MRETQENAQVCGINYASEKSDVKKGGAEGGADGTQEKENYLFLLSH